MDRKIKIGTAPIFMRRKTHFNKKWDLSLFFLFFLILIFPSRLGAKELRLKGQLFEGKQMVSLDNSLSGVKLKGLEKAGADDEKRFSLELKDIDIIGLLKIIAEKTGLSIIPSSQIKGRATFFLKNITPLEALDVVITSKSLAIDREEGVLYVMTEAEYEALYGEKYNEKRKLVTVKLKYISPTNILTILSEIKSTLGKLIADDSSGSIILIDTPRKIREMKKMIQSLDRPLQKKVFDIQYAVAVDLSEDLSSALTAGVGRIIVDERNSKLIVYDLPNKLKEITELVENLDEESRQIFIETEIIEITLSKDNSRGVNWEKFFRGTNDLDFTGNFSVSGLAKYGRISVGQVVNESYNLVLDFLQTYGDTRILSQPHIAVMNNQEASIMVGTRQPYATGTQSQGESTTISSEAIEFVDIGVKLSIKPTISKDGFIVMEINPEVSSQTDTFTTSISTVPVVSTSEAKTTVKVKDGTTIVIAGLIKDTKTDSVNKWPVLSKIPLLNIFFQSKVTTFQRSELAIFLTPHIMSGDKPLKGWDIKKYVSQGLIPEREKRKIFSAQLENSLNKEFPDKLPAKMEYPFVEEDELGEEKLGIKMKGLKSVGAGLLVPVRVKPAR